ncbi:phosphonate ABC transporter ATP-binding protein [Chachezhania sediminis]|uniref:phosphonate ABC transporter ATP-binding protein n=1 Tax=Chachezhania sediminis TaxID=2599291 RepID=UPI00131D12B3|nr:phosphonate ABC transporter ATP-binding protein [Chachezhania sediminis]
MLELCSLSRSFADVRAVDAVSLSVAPGEFVGVIGRSGAGKSTLLRLINRLVEPTGGEIRFDGETVSGLRGRSLRDWRRRSAMIFQQFNLIDRLSVLDNVLVGRAASLPRWRSWTMAWPPADRAVAIEALDRLGIADLALKRADQLSGGQQQRVAIARALVQNPQLILADEPVASLDPHSTKLVMDSLARINREDGLTVLVNLHHLELAREYCRRVVGVAAGRVVFDGAIDDLDAEAIRTIYGAAPQ